MNCRFCGTKLEHTFADLGKTPLANAYVSPENVGRYEVFYPLHAYVCSECFLVQIDEFESPENIFTDYAYFSSFSNEWLMHCKEYVQHIKQDHHVGNDSRVVEIASNDGYLLQYFLESGYRNVLGIEPAKNVAEIAINEKGIPTLVEFFNDQLAEKLVSEGTKADLIIANNVLAHVPTINSFVKGIKILLSEDGLLTIEFPHLLNLIEKKQFDTIYHEHFSYFSLFTVKKILNAFGLKVIDIMEFTTHGGSLRVYATHLENQNREVSPAVDKLIQREIDSGLTDINRYLAFQEMITQLKWDTLEKISALKKAGKKIVGFGAPAKGNTFLNFYGIKSDILEYTVDDIPYKQNRYLPGTNIKIKPVGEIKNTKPDYVLILPWNCKEEIMHKHSYISEWGGRFIVAIPQMDILSTGEAV